MAEYIKTLKEDNGDITYPVTLAGAVSMTGGVDLETTINSKASIASVNNKIDIGDVQSTDIVSNAVTTPKIDSGAVITSKIGDYAVTTNKIDAGAITTVKIAGGAVTDAKLAHDADFSSEKRIGMFNGRPLYRLIVQATSGSSTNTVNYIKTFAMNNWYEIISLYGVIYQTDRLTVFPMDGSYDRPFLGGGVSGTNYQIYEQHPASFYNSKTCRITIEYTKVS